jgi:hypothetical protein
LAADNKKPKQRQASIPPVAIVIAIIVAAGLAGLWYLDRMSKRPAPQPPPLTGAARDYVRHGFLQMADVDMKAHESYLKQQVVEITGKIANTGDRVVQLVELNCVFRDAYGQVVLRERVAIVSRKMGDLSPSEMKPFRLAFDNIPESWNQAMPELVIARIDFA